MTARPPVRALAAALAVLSATASAGTLTIKGSDTMVTLVQRWARTFREQNPDVRIQVTGGGSGTGLAALVEGSTDLAMSSRPLAPVEVERLTAKTGHAPAVISVARDGVTFFVHPSNPITSMTPGRLASVLLGDVARWSELGGPDRRIILYTRETTSGTSEYVRASLLSHQDFAPLSQPLPGTGAVVNAVSREPFALGFGGAAFAKGVRPLAVEVDGQAVAPTPDAVRSGRYPFTRAVTFVFARPPSGDARRFVEWVLSDEGQALAVAAGFFPVT
ncbi:MAG: phosphate ABC transporter substrate-binding protein [Myxococcaceae bacterium]|nr:phosphate ABC transporter substrate-binding protein [Myxococcaceae bacterium]